MWLEQRWLDNCVDVLPHKEALVESLTEEIEGIESLSDKEETAAVQGSIVIIEAEIFRVQACVEEAKSKFDNEPFSFHHWNYSTVLELLLDGFDEYLKYEHPDARANSLEYITSLLDDIEARSDWG